MNRAQKWDFVEHKYQPYEIPNGWFCPLILDDMDTIVNCASCGRELPFGDTYTSKTIHTSMGVGYLICGACSNREWAAKIAAEEKEV